MILDEDLIKSQLRLLGVDNSLVLPSETDIQLIVTSNDVIHSFAVPNLGLKIDAVPGRLNQIYLNSRFEAIFFGQCSELCGINHAFMPINLKFISSDKF
jgi:heme/copper-type cytochrome/quinol oxidase subunit 2